MVALVDGQPKLLTLKEMLEAFLRHRREVVTRRTIFDLRKARERAHILEGLAVALANIDEVIALIKASPTPAEARRGLMARTWRPGAVPEMLARAGDVADAARRISATSSACADGGYRLSEVQAQAILDLRLHRLTGLEQDKIVAEYKELLELIRDLLDILARPDAAARRHPRASSRRCRKRTATRGAREIVADESDLTIEDLIAPQDVVVTLSHAGYAKAQPVSDYRGAAARRPRQARRRRVKDEDFIDKLFVANTHDTLLCFSSRGQVLLAQGLPAAAGAAAARAASRS